MLASTLRIGERGLLSALVDSQKEKKGERLIQRELVIQWERKRGIYRVRKIQREGVRMKERYRKYRKENIEGKEKKRVLKGNV